MYSVSENAQRLTAHMLLHYCTIFNNNVVAYTHLSAQVRKKEARAHTRIIENMEKKECNKLLSPVACHQR